MTSDDVPSEPGSTPARRRSLPTRVRVFWGRHRTLFWTLHTAWALAVGTLVAIVARERSELVAWVVLFLALTWTSTLFFGGAAAEASRRQEEAEARRGPPGLVHEVTSYLTRIMYQETLFFLLPFYAYSTVARSPNVGFLVLLGALALFSCIDLLFDRWLRTRAAFRPVFFAVVAFAALNLLLPLLVGVGPRFATPAAALLAVGGAVPLAARALPGSPWARLGLALCGLTILVVAIGFPSLVPPVPIRVESAAFATDIDRRTLALPDTLRSPVAAEAVGSSLVVLVDVLAPAQVPARVRLEWRRNGETVRISREIDILAHRAGFRVWDRWRAPSGHVPPGLYEVVLRTQGDRLFGSAALRVVAR
jgi:hypothetical protein